MNKDTHNHMQHNIQNKIPSQKELNQTREKLKQLSKRLQSKTLRATTKTDYKNRATMMGFALRLSIELVVALCVAGFIGWWLDEVFSTKPICLFVFLGLGLAAGCANMVRTVKQMRQNLQNSLQDSLQNSLQGSLQDSLEHKNE